MSVKQKLISYGIRTEMSNAEKKRIRFSNGFAIITGITTVITLTTAFFINSMVNASLSDILVPVLVGILLGVLSTFVLYSNHIGKHNFASSLVIFLLPFYLSIMSVLYGPEVALDKYVIVFLLLPYGLFKSRKYIYTSFAFLALLYFSTNISHNYIEPIFNLPELAQNAYFYFHSLVQIAVAILLVRYFMNQNRENEESLEQEIANHIQTTEELKDANQSKDRFFSIIAHDLKGPVGNFATIFENYKQNEIPVDLYEHLKEASKNTYSLLQDLLTWARHKKGQIEYHTHDFLVSEIIERVISENSLNSRNKNINLVSNFCCSELYIFADMSTIHTILRNLVSNAIKFTPDGGIIEIDCECKKDFVYISVKDSGVGIPEDKLSRLFKVGERNISSPGTNNETGTGVGLLLCKEFAIGNGGDIFVESIVNKGSKFWITVPIGKKPILPSYEENIDYSKMRALVVEDNHLNMETTTMELAKLGINYEIAEDGDKAVELGTEKPYNIIFMDISLPKRNGISANKAIRKVYRDSRIAALTSFDKAEILEKDDSVIFDAYLKKPLDREELLECMNFIAIKKELD